MIFKRNKNLFLSVIFALFAIPVAENAYAQSAQGRPDGAAGQMPPIQSNEGKWSLGIGAIVQDSPFQGEKIDVTLIPVIGYQSNTFFIQGLRAGYHIKNIENRREGGFFADGYITPRMRPGESRRKLGVDAGLSGGYQFGLNTVSINAQQDISDTSNGTELTLSYGLTIPFIKNNLFLPRFSVIWQTEKLTNFLWGIDQETFEKTLANADEITLTPFNINQSVVNYSAGLTHIYRFNENWSTLSIAQVTALDDAITANPAVTSNYNYTFIFSLSYTF